MSKKLSSGFQATLPNQRLGKETKKDTVEAWTKTPCRGMPHPMLKRQLAKNLGLAFDSETAQVPSTGIELLLVGGHNTQNWTVLYVA